MKEEYWKKNRCKILDSLDTVGLINIKITTFNLGHGNWEVSLDIESSSNNFSFDKEFMVRFISFISEFPDLDFEVKGNEIEIM